MIHLPACLLHAWAMPACHCLLLPTPAFALHTAHALAYTGIVTCLHVPPPASAPACLEWKPATASAAAGRRLEEEATHGLAYLETFWELWDSVLASDLEETGDTGKGLHGMPGRQGLACTLALLYNPIWEAGPGTLLLPCCLHTHRSASSQAGRQAGRPPRQAGMPARW